MEVRARIYDDIGPFDAETGELMVVIDTPKGSRNKYKFDDALQLFRLGGVLPVGAVFPFDFGFIPNTLGGDGDPLDVLLLMEEAAFSGCLVPSRLIGVIEAEQTEDGKTERNDRLIAVTSNSKTIDHLSDLGDLNKNLVKQIDHFFVSYNEAKGKLFKPLRHLGPARAKRLVERCTREPPSRK